MDIDKIHGEIWHEISYATAILEHGGELTEKDYEDLSNKIAEILGQVDLQVKPTLAECEAEVERNYGGQIERVVRQGVSSADEICGCGGKIKSYGIAGEKYCEYCDKAY